ncbi:hypothetical protein HDU67_003113 [Dinochytrium kinnereticum]|nr:hypothetical protein HDU67_003113 [Dinochytrium kinnereticum]
MKINSYSVRALQAALGRGNGLRAKLDTSIKAMHVGFGSEACGALNALKVFSVNELPRLHTSNPTVAFTTSAEKEKKSFFKLSFANGKDQVVDLAALRTPVDIYAKLAAAAGITETTSST